ncbi:MAG: carbon storage regulator [bacterium]
MLVLSRKEKEKIRLGSNIVISILMISENQVKIGIEAPGDVKILREELYADVTRHSIEAKDKSKEKPPVDFSALSINKLNVIKDADSKKEN